MPAVRHSSAAVVASLALAALAACGSSTSTTADPASDSGGSGGSGAAQVDITMVSGAGGDECRTDTTSVPAGPVTFHVTNQSAAGITEFELLSGERIVGEKESLAPGLPEATLTLTLGGGDYALYCPGAAIQKTPFTVTGQASAAPTGTAAQLLQQGASQYASYVRTQVDGMVTGVKRLQQQVDAGNVTGAQRAYAEARPFYEKIESDVDGFLLPGADPTSNKGNLDYLIDMRASNLDPAVGWSGFHAVERDLFGAQRITSKTKAYAADLTKNVTHLAGVANKLAYKPEDLANGAAGLLEEVQRNKISGEEEAYSHLDLVDVAANVEGAQQAFLALQPGLKEIDAAMTQAISKRFGAVDALLGTEKDPKALGGYARYTPQLRKTDANKLSQTVQSLQDSLARLAEKVATAR